MFSGFEGPIPYHLLKVLTPFRQPGDGSGSYVLPYFGVNSKIINPGSFHIVPGSRINKKQTRLSTNYTNKVSPFRQGSSGKSKILANAVGGKNQVPKYLKPEDGYLTRSLFLDRNLLNYGQFRVFFRPLSP